MCFGRLPGRACSTRKAMTARSMRSATNDVRAIDKRRRPRGRIAFKSFIGLAVLAAVVVALALVCAQPNDYNHVLPPIPAPAACTAVPILAVDGAEIHQIENDRAAIVATGTASNDRWTNKRLLLSSVQSGTAFYDFVACPPDAPAGSPSGVSAFVPNAAIGGIHRIVIRAETNQQVIDVDAARRVPDPWLRVSPRPPGPGAQEHPQ
jgi:hypothetical protein